MMFCPTKAWCERASRGLMKHFDVIEQRSPGLLRIDKNATEQVQLSLVEHGVKETSDIYQFCGQGKWSIRLPLNLF